MPLRRRSRAPTSAGVGLNSILPGRAGDVVEGARASSPLAGDETYTTLAATLFVETLLDLVLPGTAVFIWALHAGSPAEPERPARRARLRLGLAATGGSKTTAIVVAAAHGRCDRVLVVGAAAHRGLQETRRRGAERSCATGRSYAREVVSWQLRGWFCRVAALYFFLRAFHVRATVHNALLAQVVDSLATLLPLLARRGRDEAGAARLRPPGTGTVRSRLLAFSVGQYVAVTVFNVAIGAIALFAIAADAAARARSSAARRLPQSEELVGGTRGSLRLILRRALRAARRRRRLR